MNAQNNSQGSRARKRTAGIAFVLMCSMAIGGCASYRPVVDTKGVNMTNYEQDLRECQTLAEQRDPTKQAVGGAIAGALLGALISAAAGGGYSRNSGAAVGAVAGGAAGAGSGVEAQISIVRNCMTGRGYRVLN